MHAVLAFTCQTSLVLLLLPKIAVAVSHAGSQQYLVVTDSAEILKENATGLKSEDAASADHFFAGAIGQAACPTGSFGVSEVSCLRAGKTLLEASGVSAGHLTLQIGDGTSSSGGVWAAAPAGCSISFSEPAILYNLGSGNAGAYVPVCMQQPWESVISVSGSGALLLDVGKDAFNWLFGRCPVVQYVRDGAVHSVYKRLTTTCNMGSAYDLFAVKWDNKPDNFFNMDFSIYNNLADATSNSMPWAFCNFGERGVGYPRECGSHGLIQDEWFALPSSHRKMQVSTGASLQIYSGPDCPSPAKTPPLCEFSRAVTLNSNGDSLESGISAVQFNERFATCPVVEYRRNGEVHSIYRRLTPLPSGFNAYSLFDFAWTNASNLLNVDFEIFSNIRNTRAGFRRWSHCEFGQPGIGYPYICGPRGPLVNRWFALPSGSMKAPALTSGASLSIYSRKDCPSVVDGAGSSVEWRAAVTVSPDGKQIYLNIGSATFNRLFRRCPVVRYTRNRRLHSVYSRITDARLVANPFDLFMWEWRSEHNLINVDFAMYSSIADSKARTNAWSFCSYDAGWGIGYPAMCGPQQPIDGQWFTMPFQGSAKEPNVTSGSSFHIYVGTACPSTAGTGGTSR
mmetsp:Transcript_61298/g.145955  ORF Transcript_61298/g.145955 Transcript_61298/m.145955 type:complete len:623 (+) Transcript_61298:92-1960(+)